MFFFCLQAINNQLDLHRQMFEYVTTEGQKILETLPEGPEHDKLETKLDNTKTRWQDLSDKLNEHSTKLEYVKPTAKVYEETSDPFMNWLSEAEARLKDCDKIPSDQEELMHVQEMVEVSLQLFGELLVAMELTARCLESHGYFNVSHTSLNLIYHVFLSL